MRPRAKKILLVASGGGHIDAAMAVIPAFTNSVVELATYGYSATKDLSNLPLHKIHRMLLLGTSIGPRLALSELVNSLRFFWILVTFRPKAILSTGAELAIPVFLLAYLIPGIRLLHLETATRVKELSLSGKILRLFCDRLFVQWPELAERLGGNAVYHGRVF